MIKIERVLPGSHLRRRARSEEEERNQKSATGGSGAELCCSRGVWVKPTQGSRPAPVHAAPEVDEDPT